MFFDSFLKYCELNGESPSAAMENAGVSHSMLAKWRAGKEPTNPTKAKLAKYFGITMSEFSGEIKEKPATKSDEPAGRKERFNAVMLLLSEDKQKMVEDFAAKLLHMQ